MQFLKAYMEAGRQMKTKIAIASVVGTLLLCAHYQVLAWSYEERVAAKEAQSKAGALAQSHCADTPLSEVRSIRELPKEVRALLERNEVGEGEDEIVDRGENFNKGDVGGGPFRRFAIAGISANCASVAVEHGGRGYNIRVFVFERNDAKWQGGPVGYIFQVPQSLSQLRQAIYPAN
jgi:hypothetical protein